MELKWETFLFFLEEREDGPPPGSHPVGNIWVMVVNVNNYWALARSLGARIANPITDRHYRLCEFVIIGPDGLNLRFATRLADLRR
jgi:hypothetical protein